MIAGLFSTDVASQTGAAAAIPVSHLKQRGRDSALVGLGWIRRCPCHARTTD